MTGVNLPKIALSTWAWGNDAARGTIASAGREQATRMGKLVDEL